jgi:hypothetical protein
MNEWLITIPLWVKIMLATLCGFMVAVWFWIGDD